jgi:predicted anti-sigma-YlaC factor YlaD
MQGIICRLIQKRLDAFQDGELGPAARAKAEAHLARCPACAGELAALGRLRAALTTPVTEPADAVWDTFWPHVRSRIAAAPPDEAPARPATWLSGVGPWRFAIGSALAAALALLVVIAPWQRQPDPPEGPRTAMPGLPAEVPKGGLPVTRAAVVESVETEDPQSSVMVFTNPDAEMTVVWVFGLEQTEL